MRVASKSKSQFKAKVEEIQERGFCSLDALFPQR